MKYTRSNKKRLIADCEKLKVRLGMGNMHVSYQFAKKDGYSLADSVMYAWGWKSRITFYDYFFESDEALQLHTILHEFVHVMMMPYDSQVEFITDAMPKKNQKAAKHNIRTSREITVDRLAATLKELL